ncbi:uridine monophosphate kinase [candidate division WOR-3 bacterium]|nr:uridine monophosphate kinase [candidate division WOR-3 bacterium]
MLKSTSTLFDTLMLDYITKQIQDVHLLGACIGVVIGGGNILRGRDVQWLNKVDADNCGMLATIINGITLHSKLHALGIPVRLSSGIPVQGVVDRCNPFNDRREFDRGTVFIFVGGTGNPLFTTDTAAALRAVEFNADVVIKATKVDGVYSADPEIDKNATRYTMVTYDEAITKNLQIMDLAAFNICRDAKIPICVYSLTQQPLPHVITKGDIGTLVTDGGKQ